MRERRGRESGVERRTYLIFQTKFLLRKPEVQLQIGHRMGGCELCNFPGVLYNSLWLSNQLRMTCRSSSSPLFPLPSPLTPSALSISSLLYLRILDSGNRALKAVASPCWLTSSVTTAKETRLMIQHISTTIHQQ